MSNLKVTKLANGLLDVHATLTQEQFDALRILATDLNISDDPCRESSHEQPKSILKQHFGPCDDCGEGIMLERTNSNTGNTFLGCSEFPECKFTKTGGSNPAAPRPTYSTLEYDDDDCADCDADYGDLF
jgi:hypothetical protein